MSKDLLALNYEKTFRDRGSGFVIEAFFIQLLIVLILYQPFVYYIFEFIAYLIWQINVVLNQIYHLSYRL